jgi:hypothetical protein
VAGPVICPNCGKEIPAALFFRRLGAAKSARKAKASRKNVRKAMRRGRWGAPKGNQNWKGRLKA